MTEYNIKVPCNEEVVIKLSCGREILHPTDPLPPEPIVDPVTDPTETGDMPVWTIVFPPEVLNPEIPTTNPVVDPVVTSPTVETEPVVEPIAEPVTEPILVTDPVIELPIPVADPVPVIEPVIPVVVPLEPALPTPVILPSPEHCYCELDSKLSFLEFAKQLIVLSKGLLYP